MNPKSHLPELENSENNNRRSKILKKRAIAVITLAFVGVFILPFLITHFSWAYDLGTSKPNEIGDTIGGILSPFIGLVSAILIYITIDQQIEANRKIQGQIDNERIDKFEETIFLETKRKLDLLENKLQNFELKNALNTAEDASQYFTKMIDFSIFEEPLFSITNSKVSIPEKYPKAFFTHFKDFLSTIAFFNSKVNTQKAYISIVYNRFNEMRRYFYSNGIIRIQSTRIKTPLTNSCYLDLIDIDGLSKVKEYINLELQLLIKLDQDTQTQLWKTKSVSFIGDIISDCIDYLNYKDLLKLKQQEIMANEHIPDYVDSYKGLDEDFENFISQLKKKGIYKL